MQDCPSSPSRRPQTDSVWAITTEDVTQGSILWLGDEEETVSSYRTREGETGVPVKNVKTKQTANAGMFGHPIVVISRPSSNPNAIYFHQMTSFAGKTLAERFYGRKAAFRQQTFCPVTPAPAHPQLTASNHRYRTLTLQDGDRLEKPSYVNVREVYRMDWRDAQPYWGADPNTRKIWKLDAVSVASLARLTAAHAGFRADAQYRAPTTTTTTDPAMQHRPLSPFGGRRQPKAQGLREPNVPTMVVQCTAPVSSSSPSPLLSPPPLPRLGTIGNAAAMPYCCKYERPGSPVSVPCLRIEEEPLLPVHRGGERAERSGAAQYATWLERLFFFIRRLRIWAFLSELIYRIVHGRAQALEWSRM